MMPSDRQTDEREREEDTDTDTMTGTLEFLLEIQAWINIVFLKQSLFFSDKLIFFSRFSISKSSLSPTEDKFLYVKSSNVSHAY